MEVLEDGQIVLDVIGAITVLSLFIGILAGVVLSICIWSRVK